MPSSKDTADPQANPDNAKHISCHDKAPDQDRQKTVVVKPRCKTPARAVHVRFREAIDPARNTRTVIRMALMTSVVLGSIVSGALCHGVSAEDIPVPPVPPADLPLPDTAPVPNLNAQAPVAAPSDAPSVDVKLYRARPYDPGVGFTPGSRYQSNEDRKPIQTPGLSFSVPIK